MYQSFFWWMMVLAWLLVIYSSSASPSFTSSNTRQIIVQLFGLQDSGVFLVDFIIRKWAHLVEFGLLAILLYKALLPGRFAFPLAWVLSTLFGAVDEWHQLHMPGRTGSLKDVLIDSIGALLALTGAYYLKAITVKENRDR